MNRRLLLLSRRLSLGLVGFSLLVASVAGCGRHGTPAPEGGSTSTPSKVNLKRAVELVQARQKSLVYFVDATGLLEAEGQTPIAPGVTGVVDEVLFREGQWVDRNTVLVKVDQARYFSALEMTIAAEKRAKANLDLAKDQVNRADRTGTGVISDEERTKATLTYRMAVAEQESAKASRDLAQHNLDRSRVRAPYAGQMNTRTVTVGAYVEEKTIVGTIADLSHIRLVGYIPEKAAPLARDMMLAQSAVHGARVVGHFLSGTSPWTKLGTLMTNNLPAFAPGFEVEFTLQPFPNKKFLARVFYMSTVADPQTHMFECKAEVSHADSSIELKPGYSANIKLPLSSMANACMIPEESMRASEQGFIAFVPQRDKDGEWIAKVRNVDRGYQAPDQTGSWVEVLKGVQPGEWLVRKGAEALEDGTPIAISKEQEQLLLKYQPGSAAKNTSDSSTQEEGGK